LLRFANPGSDIDKFVRTFGYIAREAGAKEYDLDFMVDVAGKGALVSSVGAVGSEAVRRSRRPDRSRDPMYNQLKMYSEIWRMLGWIHVGTKRLLFTTTPIGRLISETEPPLHPEDKALLQELFLGITFPNHHTENKGIDNLRPFKQLLLLMEGLDGRISRDEMIISLYTMADDLSAGAMSTAVKQVNAVRGYFTALTQTLENTCASDGVQVNTARNYTRIPIGVLTDPNIGWAAEASEKSTYGRTVKFFELTAHGMSVVERLKKMQDVRWQHIAPFKAQERSAFINLAHYAMLERAGFGSVPGQLEFVVYAEGVAARVFESLGIESRLNVLFSPYQQAPTSELVMADSFEAEWHAATH